MCEFCTVEKRQGPCDKRKPLNSFFSYIYLKDGSSDINCDCGEYESSLNINYCPMCGRKFTNA